MNLFSGIVLLGVLLACAVVGIWWKKSNVLEILVLGVSFWFSAWVVAGMGLFVLDAFRLFRCACATAGLIALTGIAAILVRRLRDHTPWKKLAEVSCDIRPYGIPLLVCAAGAVLVAVKHGFFGMGQDEGVYQTVAINLMNGITDRQQDFTEYHLVSPEQQGTFAENVYHRLIGYDIGNTSYPETVYDNNVSPVSGIYHGIPTYASILAMWGTIFGMSQMLHVQTVFYFCIIFLTFFVCQHFQLRRSSSALACILTAASPIVVWVAKSALTEGFLGVVLALFLYFLTDADHPERQWMSILPVAVFGCFHVSIYTMIPMFLVLYGGMYWITGRRSFAVLMPVTVVGYLVSFFAMRHVQPFYTMNNYSPIFGLGIDQSDLPRLIPAVCGAALVLCVAYVLLTHLFVHKKHPERNAVQRMEGIRTSATGFVLAEILLVPVVLYILLKCITAEAPRAEFTGTALWGYAACVGVIPLLAAWIVGIIRPRFYLESPQRLVILVMAFYCIAFYSAFLRYQVQYFYYYGRYLAPFLPIAAVFTALTLDRLRARVTVPVLAAGVAVLAPYDHFLAVQQDDTRLQWDVLEETTEKIQSGDCVIVDGDYMWTMYLPIRAMTGAAVYPVLDDLTDQAAQLDQQYDTVYYLGLGEWTDAFESQFRLVYSNDVMQYYDDNVSGRVGILPFPLEYQETPSIVKLYACQSEQLSYPAVTSAAERYRGFGVLEGGFCWSNTEDPSVHCYLDQRQYTLSLELGCGISLDVLQMQQYPIQVDINGKNAGTLVVDSSNNGGTISLSVPAELIRDGENVVTFHSTLWNADKIAPGDMRQLGFPLKSLTFTPED